MNYTEFKLEVMELGDFKVNKIPEKTVTVTYQNDTTQVMTISSDFKYAVDTNLISFVQLDSWAQARLFKLGMEFAESPFSDRIPSTT